MKRPTVADPEALLTELAADQVEFIVVGGTAAVLHGAPVATQDLDIVHRRTEENVVRLMNVLVRIDAIMRNDLAHRGIRPTAAMLLGSGQINLSTSLGPLDSLCELGKGQGYDELLPHSEILSDGGLTIRVLDLPTLIDVKARTGHAKDRAVLPVLIATLEERKLG